MSSFRSKPVGWQHESYRHYLASKGVSTKLRGKEYLAVKWNINNVLKKGGHVEYMSPDEYLKMIGDKDVESEKYKQIHDRVAFNLGGGNVKMIPLQEFSEKMRSGEIEVTPPEWHKTQYGTYVQEGRHRAIAAKIAGEEKIPVMVAQPKQQVSKEVQEEYIQAIHAVGGYDDEWRRRFASGNPGKYMDEGHLKLYAMILKKHGVDYPNEWDELELADWLKQKYPEGYFSRKYQASMVQRAPDSMTLKQRVKNLLRPISRDESEYRDVRNEKVVSFIPLSDVKVKSLLEDERQFTPEEKLNEVARVRFERLQRGHVNVLSPEKRLMLVPGDVVERRFVREIVPLSDKERLRRTLELRDSKYHGRAFDPVVGDLVYGQDVLRRDDD